MTEMLFILSLSETCSNTVFQLIALILKTIFMLQYFHNTHSSFLLPKKHNINLFRSKGSAGM